MFLQNPAAFLCSPSPFTPNLTCKRHNGPFSILGELSMCACACVCVWGGVERQRVNVCKNTRRPRADTHRNTLQVKHILSHALKHALMLKHHTRTETHLWRSSSPLKGTQTGNTVRGAPPETGREPFRQREEEGETVPGRDRLEATFTL